MNKIKKILLIIPILFIIGIHNVKADTIDLYQHSNSISIFGSPESGKYYTKFYTFDAFTDNFNYNQASSLNNNYINSVVYYLESSNQYLVLTFYTCNSVSSTNFDVDIDVNSDNGNAYFYYYDSSDNRTQSSVGCNANTQLFNQFFVTKTYNRAWYQTNLSWSVAWITSIDIGSYKFVYNWTNNNINILNFIENNLTSDDIVFLDRGSFYLRGVLQKTSSSSPEPEPEPEPDPEPTPQENYNKLYVPNYNENMCVEIIDKDTIRVFEDNTTLDYTDYYVNSHYLSKTGTVDSEYSKNCTQLEKSSLFIYRNDITDILFIALLSSLFTFFSIYLLFRVFRKRSR